MSKRPRVDQDLLHRQAKVAALGGLLRGEDIDAMVEAVAPSHVRGWFTPGVAMLELAVTSAGPDESARARAAGVRRPA